MGSIERARRRNSNRISSQSLNHLDWTSDELWDREALVSSIHLIHGAWHGRWCWEKLIPKLERNGHTVVARDLPGLGSDRTPAAEITLQAYVDAVCGQLAKEAEPAVVVGHRMGGVVISEVAERIPEKVKALVYLTAYLLAPRAIFDGVGNKRPRDSRRRKISIGRRTDLHDQAGRDT
jgi:pimeloyl-ACP methyl ester carboxylesterase